MTTKPKSKLRKTAPWLLLAFILLGLYDLTIFEPNHPNLVTYHVAIPNLPKNMDGFKIVQLSDLHKGPIVHDALIRRAVTVGNSLTKHNIRPITNTNTRIRNLYIVGLDDKWLGKPNARKAFKGVGAKSPYIMVSHSPLIIDLLKDRRSLLITGHTHGGQVLIPFIPPPALTRLC